MTDFYILKKQCCILSGGYYLYEMVSASAKEVQPVHINYNMHLALGFPTLQILATIPTCHYLTSWNETLKKSTLKGRWSDDGASDKKYLTLMRYCVLKSCCHVHSIPNNPEYDHDLECGMWLQLKRLDHLLKSNIHKAKVPNGKIGFCLITLILKVWTLKLKIQF